MKVIFTIEAEVYLALQADYPNDALAARIFAPAFDCTHLWPVVKAVKAHTVCWKWGNRRFVPLLLNTDLYTLRVCLPWSGALVDLGKAACNIHFEMK